jgi:hypothetical protein
MRLTGLDLWFWALGFGGYLALLVVLVGRRRVRHLPIFTGLIALSTTRTVDLYLVAHYGTKQAYFYNYWCFGIADTALELAVVYELASRIFRPLGTWAPDLKRSALWLVAGSFAVASALTWLAAPSASSWKEVVVIKGTLFSAALMGQLFVAMVALSATVGLPWKSHAARIAQGLGLYSIVDILIEAGHNLFGVAYKSQVDMALTHARMVSFLVCIAYWIWAVWQEEPEPRELSHQMRMQLAAFQQGSGYDVALLRSWRNR